MCGVCVSQKVVFSKQGPTIHIYIYKYQRALFTVSTNPNLSVLSPLFQTDPTTLPPSDGRRHRPTAGRFSVHRAPRAGTAAAGGPPGGPGGTGNWDPPSSKGGSTASPLRCSSSGGEVPAASRRGNQRARVAVPQKPWERILSQV